MASTEPPNHRLVGEDALVRNMLYTAKQRKGLSQQPDSGNDDSQKSKCPSLFAATNNGQERKSSTIMSSQCHLWTTTKLDRPQDSNDLWDEEAISEAYDKLQIQIQHTEEETRARFRQLALRHVFAYWPHISLPMPDTYEANHIAYKAKEGFIEQYAEHLWPGEYLGVYAKTGKQCDIKMALGIYFRALLQVPGQSPGDPLLESLMPKKPDQGKAQQLDQDVAKLSIQDEDENLVPRSGSQSPWEESLGKELLCPVPVGLNGEDLRCGERFSTKAELVEHQLEDHGMDAPLYADEWTAQSETGAETEFEDWVGVGIVSL